MATLKVMSFNILSDAPIWKKKWAHIKKDEWMMWDYRKEKILDIITSEDPDICLLCECQYDQILFFAKYCTNFGYGYVYSSTDPRKSDESVLVYKDYTHLQNPGILIMYKINAVRLINNHAIDYIDGVNKLEADDRFKMPCVSNIVLFEKNDSLARFYFVGLHHNNKQTDGVREFEIGYLLAKIKNKNSIYKYPVIICGDFNTLPSSTVYNMIVAENYCSSYKIITGKELGISVSTEHFKDTLDYIFVDEKCNVKNVKIINEDDLRSNIIPNAEYPSDHMYLTATIELLR